MHHQGLKKALIGWESDCTNHRVNGLTIATVVLRSQVKANEICNCFYTYCR